MAKTYTQLVAGLKAKFLADADVAAAIGERFWELGDESFMAVFESLQQDPAASHGKFVTHRDAGARAGRLMAGKESKLMFQGIELVCYARYVSQARVLRDTLLAVIGQGFTGSVGSGGDAVNIKNATWQREAQETDFNETLKMSVANAALLVPYENI